MKNTIRQNKGITLIALVITIIVLLILAGVTIAMLSGENGILGRAQETNMKNDYSSAEERVRLAYMSVKTEIMTQKVTNSSYNAQSHGNELATLVRKDLTGRDATNSEWTKCEYNSTSKAIEITYTKSSLKEGGISEDPKKPQQNGYVEYEIGILPQDATLKIDGVSLDVPDGSDKQDETKMGLWINGTKISDYSLEKLAHESTTYLEYIPTGESYNYDQEKYGQVSTERTSTSFSSTDGYPVTDAGIFTFSIQNIDGDTLDILIDLYITQDRESGDGFSYVGQRQETKMKLNGEVLTNPSVLFNGEEIEPFEAHIEELNRFDCECVSYLLNNL